MCGAALLLSDKKQKKKNWHPVINILILEIKRKTAMRNYIIILIVYCCNLIQNNEDYRLEE